MVQEYIDILKHLHKCNPTWVNTNGRVNSENCFTNNLCNMCVCNFQMWHINFPTINRPSSGSCPAHYRTLIRTLNEKEREYVLGKGTQVIQKDLKRKNK